MLRRKWNNLIYAVKAIGYLWQQESSFRIQVVSGIVTFSLAYALHISLVEWLFVIVITGAVLAVEAINTAIEDICDVIIAEHHPRIGIIKDLGALASGFIGFTALVIGIIIFVPKILALVW